MSDESKKETPDDLKRKIAKLSKAVEALEAKLDKATKDNAVMQAEMTKMLRTLKEAQAEETRATEKMRKAKALADEQSGTRKKLVERSLGLEKANGELRQRLAEIGKEHNKRLNDALHHKNMAEAALAFSKERCEKLARHICMADPGEFEDVVTAAEQVIADAEARKPKPEAQPAADANVMTDEEIIEAAKKLDAEPCATSKQ